MLQGILSFFYYLWGVFVIIGTLSFLFQINFKKKDEEGGGINKIKLCLSIAVLIIGAISGAVNLMFFTKAPNIVSLKISDAAYRLSEHDLEIDFPPDQEAADSNSIVTSQLPAANTIVLKGAKVIVSFDPPEQSKGSGEADPSQDRNEGEADPVQSSSNDPAANQTTTVNPAQPPASASTTTPTQAPAWTPSPTPSPTPAPTPIPAPAPTQTPVPPKDPYSDPYFRGNASVGGGITIGEESNEPEPEKPTIHDYPEQNVISGSIPEPQAPGNYNDSGQDVITTSIPEPP